MKKRIELLIPTAMAAIEKNLLVPNSKSQLDVLKVYKGYISAFGSGIANSGLLTTVALFRYASSSDADKNKLLKAIYQVAFPQAIVTHPDLLSYLKKACELDEHLSIEQSKIEDAAVALKIAIRSFNLVKTDKKSKS